jgi:hypothetical protein
MKKLIVGLMGLMLVGAMSLPVAAQGRRSTRDNQTSNIRRGNTQRNDFGFSRSNNDQRDNRYDQVGTVTMASVVTRSNGTVQECGSTRAQS